MRLVGPIGEGLAAELVAAIEGPLAMVSRVTGGPARVVVDLHSEGGSVMDGWRIYGLLETLKAAGHRVEVEVNALAASMASVIAMAGDVIRVPKNGWMMVHEPWSFSAGTAGDLRRDADLLERLGDQIVGAYTARTGLPEEKIRALMAVETWMDGQEALSLGFADEVTGEVAAAAMSVGAGALAAWRHPPGAVVEAAAGEPEAREDDAAAADTDDVAGPPETFELETQDEQEGATVDPPPVPEAAPAEGAAPASAGEPQDPAAPRAGWVRRIRDALGGLGELQARCDRAEARAAGLEAEVAALRTRCSEAEAMARELGALEQALAKAEQDARDAARKAADLLAATGVAAACDTPGDDALPSPCGDAPATARETWLAMPAGEQRAAYYTANRAAIEAGA